MVHATPNGNFQYGNFAFHLHKPSTNRFLHVNGKQPRSTSEGTPQFPNGISGKLPYHLTSNRNFRIFWPNGKHPFSRLDRSDRNGPFHLTIPIHFQSQDLAVRYLPCTKWRKILITVPLWIVNSRSIGVTRTSM